MSGNARYDVSMRLRAVELYEQGCGRDKIASLLGMSSGAAREWWQSTGPLASRCWP